jgi:hypothetical protein
MTTVVETSTDRDYAAAEALSPTPSGIDVLVLDHRDRLVSSLLRVGQFRTLGESWNSYGSPPPSEQLIQVVEGFVATSDKALSPFLPAPFAVPVPGGGIKLTWSNGYRELELEFGPISDGHLPIEFLRVSHGEPLSEGSVGGRDLIDHLTWIIQG